jgi:hypothetical protein
MKMKQPPQKQQREPTSQFSNDCNTKKKEIEHEEMEENEYKFTQDITEVIIQQRLWFATACLH